MKFLKYALFSLFLLVSLEGISQVIVFSETFDGAVKPYTTDPDSSFTQGNCSNFVTASDTASNVCGGSFNVNPMISNDASGSGKFIFEGTSSGPSYKGIVYQVTLSNTTLLSGNTFTISFKVNLADGVNLPGLQPKLNGVSIGTASSPASGTAGTWQPLSFTYTTSSNLVNPVFLIYDTTSNGLGNDFGLDEIKITAPSSSAFTLPLTFTGLSVSEAAGTVVVQWQSDAGSDVHSFTVQGSSDGKNFTDVGELAAKDQADGNSYIFQQPAPLSGQYYYRIEEIDIDGLSTYSPIQAILLNGSPAQWNLLSNPVRDGLLKMTIYSPSPSSATCRIFSADGRLMLTKASSLQTGINPIDTDITFFPRGIYFAQLYYNGNTSYDKFIKQ